MFWGLKFWIFIFQFLVNLIAGKLVLPENMKEVTDISQ